MPNQLLLETKEDKLKHYEQRELQQFSQYDGWNIGADLGDDLIRPDEDGHWLCAGMTNELMYGPEDGVRILIPVNSTKDQIVPLLKKLTAWIEKHGPLISAFTDAEAELYSDLPKDELKMVKWIERIILDTD